MKGYNWVADEMIESVSYGYICCSNATEHTLKKGEVTSPKTTDWFYYWAIEQIDEKNFYAWFIEKTINSKLISEKSLKLVDFFKKI